MGISFSQIILSTILFCLGYYFKARYEINQEEEIRNFKGTIQQMKEDHKEEVRVLKNKYSQLERAKDFLQRNFLEFQEKVKLDRFDLIVSKKNEAKTITKTLKQFL